MRGEDYPRELKGRRKNGNIVWVNVRTTVMLDHSEEIIGFIGVSHDITEQTIKELLES